MRAIRKLEEVGVLHTAKSSALSRAYQFVNEWELQFMVMASFTLQVFLFFFSGFRKRHGYRVLSVLLWLAYVSANPLATFILGRLTLRRSGNPLALFWAPFLLLHLGGQETMTAFSMEDNALWKRHLLSLATQVPTAAYVVSKQLRRGDDRQLVAPMLLVFVTGTVKYAERIWALRKAGTVAPGSSSTTLKLVSRASSDAVWNTQAFYGQLCYVISRNQERNFEAILDVATEGFKLSLHFLMDMTPSISLLPNDIEEIKKAVEVFRTSENIIYMAYKLAEINLSLIYDYLYTKFGTRHFHIVPVCSGFHRIATLALTSAALGLFVKATAAQKGHDAPDVVISYVLLVGAIVLETCAIFVSFISSCWAYKTAISCSLKCPLCGMFPRAIAAMISIARLLHPEKKAEWSAKMAQYSIVGDCIKKKKESGLFKWMMRWIGIDQRAITHVGVSPEVKKLLLDKLLDIASTPRVHEWDIGVGKFSGQWAQWVVETKQDRHRSAAQQVLQISNLQGLEFVSSVLLWHIVTDICLLSTDVDIDSSSSSHEEHLDDGSSHHEDVNGGPSHEVHLGSSSHHGDVGGSGSPVLDGCSRHREDADNISAVRGIARELSDYIMYLVADCGAMAGSEGHYAVIRGQREISRWLLEKSASWDRRNVIQEIRDEESSFFHEDYYPVLDRARRVASDLLKILEAADRWELIAAVWLEMLCYIAFNCGATFHAKYLTTGGEFVTHVKMLLFMIGVPFLRDVKEPLFSKAGDIYS